VKKFFLKDSILKVVSFVLAIGLWFYVILVVDPSVTITVSDIPIRFRNLSKLEEQNLTLIKDGDMFVELEIKGSRKKIVNIDNENVHAYVDLESVTEAGVVSLPVSLSIPYEYEEIASKDPYNVNVRIDNIVTVKKDIEVKKTGTVAEEYSAEPFTYSPQQVELRGAASIIDTIKSVEVTLDYAGRSDEINDREKPYFVGMDGKIIALDDDIYNNVSIDVAEVEVSCAVLKTKKVPVEMDFEDEANYRVSASPINVKIKGDAEVVDQITKIDTEPIVVDPALEEQDIEVHLVLPEGTSMHGDSDVVSVHIERRN